MKKLIPALCMLLVAACLMGTSTYAWFSAGTTVTANGMSVTATSSGGLAIATSSSKNDGSIAAANFTGTEVDVTAGWNNGATKVSPTSTADADDWYSAVSSDVDEYAKKDANYTLAVEGAITEDGKLGAGYFYHSQVYIKTLNQNATAINPATLYVQSVTVDLGAEANDLEPSLRIAFKCGSNVVVFAPYRATDFVGNHVASTTATALNSAYTKWLPGTTTGTSATAPLSTTFAYGDTAYEQVDMFIYYEGEDPNCMSKNAINLDAVTVNVTFGSTVPTAS